MYHIVADITTIVMSAATLKILKRISRIMALADEERQGSK